MLVTRSITRLIAASIIGLCALVVLPHDARSIPGQKYMRYYTTVAGTMDQWDVVSFFNKNPTKGEPKYHHVYDGSVWVFSSAENLKKFKASPRSYVPQFGGYCAYNMARASFRPPDIPGAWTVYRGKLYFNSNPKMQSLWKGRMLDYIQRGESNWRRLKPVRSFYDTPKKKRRRRK